MGKKGILICGAGSIGIYLGALLHAKKHNVQLFGRRKLRQVSGNYITIRGKTFEIPEKLFKIPGNRRYDFIFITSKLYDFDKIINLIKKSGTNAKIIAAVQNGLVDISKYDKVLNKKILPVTVFSGFNINGNKIKVSPTPIGWKTEYSRNGKIISKLLFDAGVPCTSDKKFNSLRAEKTIVNSCLNALSAIENEKFSELFKNKKTRKRIEKLFEECYNILSKSYKLEKPKTVKKRMFKNWGGVEHYSSTCQDILSGRKNEAKFFNGYIIELAKKYNLPAKENKKILQEIRQIERGKTFKH